MRRGDPIPSPPRDEWRKVGLWLWCLVRLGVEIVVVVTGEVRCGGLWYGDVR